MNEEYLKFNVGSINDLIKQKLSVKYPDVKFAGSSANILSEAISSTFGLVMYQLNRTASNSQFSKTNSISSIIDQTKELGYNPVGFQASSMFVNINTQQTLDNISYTIPRYTNFTTPVGNFTTTEDLEFTYNNNTDIAILESVITKGGEWVEYPLLFSDGTTNQKFIITNSTNNQIDHNNLHIYVKDEFGVWEQWLQTDSLFLSSGTDKHFEARLNTLNSYDITFGDDINGKLINKDSEIAIYYLATHNPSRNINVGDVTSDMVRFTTSRVNDILIDILDTTKTSIINRTDSLLTATNTSSNTDATLPETLEEIRRNAPVAFQTQNRLVTKTDFKSFVLNNFNEFISDVFILSNDEYLDQYLKYYYDQGLNNPLLESRSLFSQINYSDSCNFNNTYIFLIPKTGIYVSDIQKQLIINATQSKKTITSNIVPSDPIYINFGLATPTSSISKDDLNTTNIEITKTATTNRSNDDIISEVYDNIVKYFEDRSSTFSNKIDVFELNASLLLINGVQDIHTINQGVSNQGVQFYKFDPQFPDKLTNASTPSEFDSIFVPILSNVNLINQINIKNV